jgi:hypothetical protein
MKTKNENGNPLYLIDANLSGNVELTSDKSFSIGFDSWDTDAMKDFVNFGFMNSQASEDLAKTVNLPAELQKDADKPHEIRFDFNMFDLVENMIGFYENNDGITYKSEIESKINVMKLDLQKTLACLNEMTFAPCDKKS